MESSIGTLCMVVTERGLKPATTFGNVGIRGTASASWNGVDIVEPCRYRETASVVEPRRSWNRVDRGTIDIRNHVDIVEPLDIVEPCRSWNRVDIVKPRRSWNRVDRGTIDIRNHVDIVEPLDIVEPCRLEKPC